MSSLNAPDGDESIGPNLEAEPDVERVVEDPEDLQDVEDGVSDALADL